MVKKVKYSLPSAVFGASWALFVIGFVGGLVNSYFGVEYVNTIVVSMVLGIIGLTNCNVKYGWNIF